MLSDLYARKSNQDAGRSVERQEAAWRADCMAEGIQLGRVFVDPHFSASKYARKARPDFAALLEYIQASRCEMVSLWEISRGSRRMGEWVHFVDLCVEQGVLIRVFGFGGDAETFDPRRLRDREALLMGGISAEAEAGRLSSRSQAGIAYAAAQGRPPSRIPDGYEKVYGPPTDEVLGANGTRKLKVEVVINEERAQLYRWAAEGLINGMPATTIAKILNAWQVRSPTGKGPWYPHAIVNALLRPSMEGHRIHLGKIAARNAWPAILDPDTAARLRTVARTSNGMTKPRDTSLRHMLSGALLCGLCQRPLQAMLGYGEGPKAKKSRYSCVPTRLGCGRLSGPLDTLNEFISDVMIRRLQTPEALSLFEPSADDTELREAQVVLDALAGRRDELYASAAKPGGPSMALVAAAERELVPQIEAAQRKIRTLRTPPVLRGYDPSHLATHWDTYPVGDRRAVIVGLAELVLSPLAAAAPRRWSTDRLRASRWRGDALTWGERWDEAAV